MKRLGVLLLLGFLTACNAPRAPDAGANDAGANDAGANQDDRSATKLANGTVCRVGPDGGPVVADRGIGGTGAPVLADRGIGGTGIVGVITGFASICVNGLEVQYDSSAAVDIDGTAASTSALRVGQVVAIEAVGPETAPVAQSISVRREVAGRIEAVELGSGTLTIAGQPVSVPAGTWGANSVRLGDWVAVSGLRRSDGTLIASRLDSAPAGVFSARGQVTRDASGVRVGDLTLHGAAAMSLKAGQFVAVSGQYVAGKGQVASVTADTMVQNPGGYFGSSVNHLIVQAFVRVADGGVWLNGMKVSVDPGVHEQATTDGVAVVSLRRNHDGSLTAVGLHYTDYHGLRPGPAKISGDAIRGDPQLPLPASRRTVASDSAPSDTGASGQSASASGPSDSGTPVTTTATTNPISAGGTSTNTGSGTDGAPPAQTPPASTPPASTPPASTPPVVAPPVVVPPVVAPPVGVPPVVAPPATSATGSPSDTPPPTLQSSPAKGPTIESVQPDAGPSIAGAISSLGSSGNPTALASTSQPSTTGGRHHGSLPGRSVIVGASTSTPTIGLLTGGITPVSTLSASGAVTVVSTPKPINPIGTAESKISGATATRSRGR